MGSLLGSATVVATGGLILLQARGPRPRVGKPLNTVIRDFSPYDLWAPTSELKSTITGCKRDAAQGRLCIYAPVT
jgi:hypothetical protein